MKSAKPLILFLVTILVLTSFVPALTHRVQSSRPASPTSATRTLEHDVRAFGDTGDGKTLDTAAINKAIEQAASEGAGTIRFPAGTYLSFSIRLKSNITLFLDQGATLVAADPKEHKGTYDAAEPDTQLERVEQKKL